MSAVIGLEQSRSPSDVARVLFDQDLAPRLVDQLKHLFPGSVWARDDSR